MYVQDPISVSYFILPTMNGDMKVLVFGELHKKKTKCLVQDEILEFPLFLQLYQSMFPRSVFDLFTESTLPIPSRLPASRKKKPNTEWDYGLGFLRYYLNRCAPKFIKDRDSITYQCPDNLRVHLCDIRQFFVYPLQGMSKKRRDDRPFRLLQEYFENSQVRSDNIKDIRYFIRYWGSTLNDPASRHFIDDIFAMSMTHLKILKQIDHIRSQRIRQILMEWGVEEWSHLLQMVREKWARMKTAFESRTFVSRVRQRFVGVPKSGKFITAYVAPFLSATIDLNTVLMDMYLMGRMLRTFADGSVVRNAILYTGEYHSHHYRTILRLLGSTEVFTSVPPDLPYDVTRLNALPSCVDITPLWISMGFPPA